MNLAYRTNNEVYSRYLNSSIDEVKDLCIDSLRRRSLRLKRDDEGNLTDEPTEQAVEAKSLLDQIDVDSYA